MTELRSLQDICKMELIYEFNVEATFEHIHTGNSMYILRSYRNGGARLIKSKTIHKIQNSIKQEICVEIPEEVRSQVFGLSTYCKISLGRDWFTKHGKLKRIDLTNVYKPIEDAIAEAIEIDDSLDVDNRTQKCFHEGESYIVNSTYRLYRGIRLAREFR